MPGQYNMTNDISPAQAPYPYTKTFWFTAFFFLIAHGRMHLLIPVLQFIPCAMISGLLAVTAFFFEHGGLRENHVLVREEKLVLGYVAVCIATLPTSIWLGGSINGLKGFLPIIVVMFITVIICRSVNDIEKFVWILALNSIFLTYMVLGKDVSHISKGITDTYDSNDIAMILDCALPILFYYMQTSRGIKRIILLACLILIGAAVIKTASRGGMLGLIAIGGYMVMYSRSKVKYLMLGIVTTLFIIAFAPDETKERFTTMLKPQTEYDQNLGDRTQIWKAGVNLFFRSPLMGVGYGNYTVADGSMKEGGMWKTAHNSFIQAAVELGIFGFVLFILLSAGTFLKFRRLRKSIEAIDYNHEILWIIRGIELSLLVYMVTAFFLSQAYSPLFFYIISLAAAARKFLPKASAAGSEQIG